MQRNQEQLRFSAVRRAFTLVEMMVVCVIIILLAALSLFAVNKVSLSTKITKTRSTIQKIDVALRQIFETYEDQFIAIKRRVDRDYPEPAFSDRDRQRIAAHFIRDLMRMEMPQNWAEVNADPLKMSDEGYSIEPSPLLNYYREAYKKATASGVPSQPEAFRAALLFLIVQNLNPETLEAFHGNEIADTNGDGLLEFVDAWGKPIQFLRWAPAFPGSDSQPDVLAFLDPPYDQGNDNHDWWIQRDQRLLDAMASARIIHADPTDERENTDEWKNIGWFLYPLIYSAGPNGNYGIETGEENVPTVREDGILDPFASPIGMPDGTRSHFDNIHNHQWYRSF